MTQQTIKIFGISGSLRRQSAATAVLSAVGQILPEGTYLDFYEDLKLIPPFDDSEKMPETVRNFVSRIEWADGVLFVVPEYAFGVPGVLKNALDWTVSTTAFNKKPVMLVTAALHGEKAHQSLFFTLTALGTGIEAEDGLIISSVRSKLNEAREIKDPHTSEQLGLQLQHFIKKIQARKLQSAD